MRRLAILLVICTLFMSIAGTSAQAITSDYSYYSTEDNQMYWWYGEFESSTDLDRFSTQGDGVIWAYQNGLFLGDLRPNGKIRINPVRILTCAEFAYALYVAYGDRISANDAVISDLPSRTEYSTAVKWAVGAGLMDFESGEFNSNSPSTRLLMLDVLYRVSVKLGISIDTTSMVYANRNPPTIDENIWSEYRTAFLTIWAMMIDSYSAVGGAYLLDVQLSPLTLSLNLRKFTQYAPELGLDYCGEVVAPPDSTVTVVFTDVATSHWACGYVEDAYDKGLVNGMSFYDQGNTRYVTYAPEGTLTRAQLAQLIYNAYKDKLSVQLIDQLPNISQDAWFYGAVHWIISADGADADFFANSDAWSNTPADRGWTADVLQRISQQFYVTLPKSALGIKFPDIANTDYEAAIIMLAEAGLIDGFEDGTFQPGGTLTRAQAAKLLDIFTNIPGLEVAGR